MEIFINFIVKLKMLMNGLDYDKLSLKKKINFDIMVAIPIINKTFEINKFKN